MDLLAWMERWEMLPQDGGMILCALSGGRDSVCLLHYLKELSQQRNFSVAAAHFNHQMRPTAQRDEEFCRALCREWGITFTAGRGDVYAAAKEHGWSGEEAARQLRYRFLEQTVREMGAERLATAHHLNDQAETVLLHLLRGSGMEGLCGIPPRRGQIVRPLLQTSRREIEDYLKENHLPYVDDESNESDRFARNALRLHVWPDCEAIYPAAAAHIGHTAALLRQEDDYLNALAQAYLPTEGTAVRCEQLQQAPEVLQRRALRLLVQRTEAGQKDFGAVHYEALLALTKNGGALDLPGGLRALCRDGVLRLERKAALPAAKPLEATTSWGDYTIYWRKYAGNSLQKEDTILLNCGKIHSLPLVRAMRSDDRLTLPGSRGSRSVKRLLSERGVPPERRQHVPVFCLGDRLAAVYGVGTDVAFMPHDGDEIMEITVKKTIREDTSNG